ncbi:unnamed protein product [Gongylonema pulchrum]|uniref:Protein kinase domain-containing protein n=1 Tax=Gongylonema pulchrum TaxID=637853 RepID=A0A183E220_9BILA|nr:unnamed protein product [Gongylonema pulchrum]
MEELEMLDEMSYKPPPQDSVEITIKAPKPVETIEAKWAKFIRQAMHLLCYIAHLQIWTRALVRNEALMSLCLSLIPEGYITAAQHGLEVATAERFLKWFRSAFQQAQKDYIAKDGFCDAQVERLEELIGDRVYENDKDLASLLFLCMLAMKQSTRLCLSCQPVTHRLTMQMLQSVHTEKFVKESIDNRDAEWEDKLEEVTKKVEVKEQNAVSATEETAVEDSKDKKARKSRKNSKSEAKESASTSDVGKKLRIERNYWVEYWDDNDGMDPWTSTVDMPAKVEADATAPMHYVIVIDNGFGMRDVTARYASKFLASDMRRLRADPDWWAQTIKLFRSKDRRRERMEDVAIHEYLMSQPTPATVAEYKNHPFTVDMPAKVEADATAPMHYVIVIDNGFGMRDVTARYASKFLASDMRRLRADPDWWAQTIKLFRSKDRRRERMEDVAIHEYLMSQPTPATVAEYKNHPLYVLKKDILKYEAIYPENQQPIGQIRGIDIYPRSSVFHLDGSLNWMKQARMVKAGEKPYKIVKGRVNPRIPPELREPRSLELFGFWQTEPYVPPKVVDGRVPRNEFGNLYVYKSSMIPEGCVHVRLDGLVAGCVHVRLDGLVTVARQLDIDCVPAVVGWEFHKGGNHPIIEGCVVLKEHEKALRAAWREFYERKQVAAEKVTFWNILFSFFLIHYVTASVLHLKTTRIYGARFQRRKERAIKNWRRLVKGLLTLKKLVDEKLEHETAVEVKAEETPATDDMAFSWPRTAFNLSGTSTEKHQHRL